MAGVASVNNAMAAADMNPKIARFFIHSPWALFYMAGPTSNKASRVPIYNWLFL
jgi:hypothetical protein